MLINLKLDGSISKIVPEHIYQGSIDVDKIDVLCKFPDTAIMTLTVTQVDGTTLDPFIMTNKSFNEEFRLWSVSLGNIITQDKGTVKLSFRVLGENEEVLQTATLNVQIEESQVSPLPPAPTPDVYEQILRELAKKQNINEDRLTTTAKTIWQSINELNEKKQDKVDTNIQVPNVNNDVVGAINYNYNTAEQNKSNIDLQGNRIAQNERDIAELKENQLSGINFIDWYDNATPQAFAPTSQDLTAFVRANTDPSREPKNGDLVKFVLIVEGDVDQNYDVFYAQNKWGTPVPIQTIEKASNTDYGTIKGTQYDELDVRHNVANGKIIDVTTKDNQGIQRSIAPRMNTIDKNQVDIISGAKAVGVATKAVGDENGENINTTYAKANDVYTKAESDEMFLPSTYTNVYYYSQGGIVDNVPTTPPDEKQFEVTSTQIGSTTIFDLQKVVEANYNFNKNSTDKSTFWLKADRDCVLEFRLTTSAIKGDITTLLNVELTGELVFKANALKQVNINSIYNGLGEDEYKLLKGDKLVKKLEVVTTESTSTTIALFSGITNASTFNLVAQSISFNVNTINGKKKINILANEWTDNGDGTYSVEITPLRHEQAPSNEYGLDLQIRDSANSIQRIAFTPKITDDGVITITSYDAIDCELLIWSAVQEQQRGILALDNPDKLPNIDYLQVGTLRITQTTTPSELTLPIPKNVATAIVIHISNASASTQAISVNGVTIEVDNVVAFKWDGVEFQVYNTPDNTSEIYDDFNNQELNATLRQAKEQLTSNMDEINLITTEISDLNTAVALKLNSKSVELKEGLAVDNLVDFYKYFFNLRKGVDRVWEFEVGKGKNENIMSIFGYPYGEQSSNSAELIVIREATSGIGYTLKIIYTSEKSSTTHIGYIKGWLISGTTYDKYIHFTGWNNARGKKWVDDISQQMTINGTQESVYGIGDILKRPKSNQMIVKVTKGNHSYNGNLLFDTDSQNSAESTIKVDNEDIYFSIDYDTKQFRISKNTSGDTTITLHLFEQR